MIWTILVVIVVVILGKFLLSLNSDNNELESLDLQEKFQVLLEILNNQIFEGDAFVTKLDKRSFNLGETASNKIVQFFYSTGNLSITFRTKQFGGEITCQRDFPNLRHVNNEKQQQIAMRFVEEIRMKLAQY